MPWSSISQNPADTLPFLTVSAYPLSHFSILILLPCTLYKKGSKVPVHHQLIIFKIIFSYSLSAFLQLKATKRTPMASRAVILLASVLLLSCLAQTTYGVLFSTLKQTLVVSASYVQSNGTVLKAGEDTIKVTWGLNQSLPANTASAYKTVTVKLCYAPVSQVDRAWRKTVDNLVKDKTCTHKIVARPYNASMQTFEWTIERDIPTGTYFVRAYAFDAAEVEVAYGQNTGPKKDTNLFEVQAITGRHITLDIVSVCFSAFSVLSLAGFFTAEKMRAKKASKRSGGH